jgi:phosphate-selective porin OprO/OprP
VFDGDDRAAGACARTRTWPRRALVDSGQFTDADNNSTLGLEGVWVHGPFKLQSEYMKTNTSRQLHDDFDFDSWYVSGVWNITGETWRLQGRRHHHPAAEPSRPPACGR